MDSDIWWSALPAHKSWPGCEIIGLPGVSRHSVFWDVRAAVDVAYADSKQLLAQIHMCSSHCSESRLLSEMPIRMTLLFCIIN